MKRNLRSAFPKPAGKVRFERDTYKYALECIVNDKKIGNEELGVAAEWYRTVARNALEQGGRREA